MKILVASSWPPMPCGIGAYAVQQVAALRREGHIVDVLSPPEGDGDFTAELRGRFRFLRLLRYAWAYERVYIHYCPAFFFESEGKLNRAASRVAWLLVALFLGAKLHVIIHETDYKVDAPLEGGNTWRNVERLTWKRAGKILFHSARERDAFARRFGFDAGAESLEVVEHGRHFVSNARMTREEARRHHEIGGDKTLFLCIGFVQPHKGFERMIDAMRAVRSNQALLRIVGSVRIPWPPANEYARELHRSAAEDPRCAFLESFVDDEAFDTWLLAADYVVVPYHEIWSSSVAARAALHGRAVIASAAGALPEQMPPGSRAFETDEELVAILREIMGEAPIAAQPDEAISRR